jgi:curved DNA-binding protein CbpA
MHDPYEILGLPADADDAQIRSQYLQCVKEFSPDRAPERFAAIRAAYDELRDPAARLEKLVFSPVTRDSLDALQKDVVKRLQSPKLPISLLLSLADAP